MATKLKLRIAAKLVEEEEEEMKKEKKYINPDDEVLEPKGELTEDDK